MWIANSNIKTTIYNYISGDPSKKDYIISNSDFITLNSNNISFLAKYNLINLSFTPLFNIADYKTNTSYTTQDFIVDNDTVYIDDGDFYTYVQSIFDIPLGKSYLQQNSIYKSSTVSPISIIRPSSITTAIYGTFRYKIENIGTINNLNIFFTDMTPIRNIFITRRKGDPMQLINKAFLDSYTFTRETEVAIDFRVKIYDPLSNTQLSLFNNKIQSTVLNINAYSHTLTDPYTYNSYTDGLTNYKRLLDYSNITQKGFIITPSNVFIVS